MRLQFVDRVIEIAYHRNGISGNGFHVVLFEPTESPHSAFLAIVFAEPGNVAVLDVQKTYDRNIAFANGNSWRGGKFEKELREAIKEWR